MKSTSKEIFNTLLNDKKVKATTGNDTSFEYTKIPFNIPQLDKITKGGIPRKRFTLLFGGFSSGKSYVASQLCKTVQEDGGVAVWVDLEKSWDSDWMTKSGLNTKEMIVYNPDTSEEAFKAVRNSLQVGADIVVIDSVAGLVPADIFTHEDGIGHSPIAWQSRTWNQMLMRLIPELKHGGALVAINQTRGTMGNVQMMDTMPGGEGQKYFTHCCMHFTRGSWLTKPGKSGSKNMSDRMGFEINARLLKDKFGGEKFEQVVVPFKFDGGIDMIETYVRVALEEGIIEQKGAMYYYKTSNFRGMNALVAWFKETPEEYEELVDATKSHTLQETLIARVLDEVGLRYTWQIPVGKYVPDFIVTEINVIIEADGPFGHFAKRDALRDEYLKEAGYEIVHVKRKNIQRYKGKDMAGIEAINNLNTTKKVKRTKNQDRWLLKAIDNVLGRKNSPPSKGKFYPSNFGNPCDKYLYLAYNGLLDWDTIKPRIQRIFDHGGTFEGRMKKYLEKAELYIADEVSIKSEDPPISGRIDFIIKHEKYDEALLELKTIKAEDYKELKEAPKHEHFIQLQIYLNLSDRDYGVVLYENKNDQNFKAFKVDRDKKVWEDILKRCEKIMTMTVEPEECTGMWYCKCKNRRT